MTAGIGTRHTLRCWIGVALIACALIALPLALTQVGTAWVRITNLAILFVLLSLGLNIVVGFAGLLDLGYIAFYAVGAYVYALLASPHFGLHLPFWVILPIGAVFACLAGVLLGAPTLRLRGDYLAIVTLGFGEIVRIFMNNLSSPVQHHQRAEGHHADRSVHRSAASSSSGTDTLFGLAFTGPTKYYYILLLLLLAVIVINLRLQNSRIGRAWVAIREDEVAAKACGINTRNVKLLAFAMGASFGGIAGGMFSAMQGFISPESFVLHESILVLSMVVLGGMGNVWGVIAGAILLSFVPELLRYTVVPAQNALFGRLVIDPEVLRMLLFGMVLVLIMRFRPAGLWPEARHKREFSEEELPSPNPLPREGGDGGSLRSEINDRPGCGTVLMSGTLLEAQSIGKRFGGVRALHQVSLTIGRGEIYGLIGPNGAGKTTFFNVLTGLYSADQGGFVFDDAPLKISAPHEVAAAGIARTFQNIRLFGNMTALENVMVGRHLRTRAGVFGAMLRDRATRDEEEAIAQRAHELLRYVGIERRGDDPGTPSFLRRPAPSGNRARACHRAETAGAGRTGCRHERNGNRSPQETDRSPARRRPHHPAHRTRREAGNGTVRPRCRARLRRENCRRRAGRSTT